MAHYYLVSSLPQFGMDGPPPLSAEAFAAQCAGVLSEAELSDVRRLLGLTDAAPQTEPARKWLDFERNLIREIARVRAARANVDLKLMDPYTGEVEPAVGQAFSLPDPGQRDRELDRFRWQRAERLAARDPFGFAAVAAFAVRLKLAERRAGLDARAGAHKITEQVEAAVQLGF